jgi:hypothetical protein
MLVATTEAEPERTRSGALLRQCPGRGAEERRIVEPTVTRRVVRPGEYVFHQTQGEDRLLVVVATAC